MRFAVDCTPEEAVYRRGHPGACFHRQRFDRSFGRAAAGESVSDTDTGCQFCTAEDIAGAEIAQNLYDERLRAPPGKKHQGTAAAVP